VLKVYAGWLDAAGDADATVADSANAAKIPHWRNPELRVAVCAGPREAEQVLAQLGWEDFPRENLIASGEISRQNLEALCRDAKAKNPFFFGTAPADLEAWSTLGKGVFIAVGPHLADIPSPVRDSLHFETLEQALSALLT
jgi:hypothetical protein